MNMQEYLSVKTLSYLEYCHYLQNKYGIGLCDYMTSDFVENMDVFRTDEGLVRASCHVGQTFLHDAEAKEHM